MSKKRKNKHIVEEQVANRRCTETETVEVEEQVVEEQTIEEKLQGRGETGKR